MLDGAGFESLGAIDFLVKGPDCFLRPFSFLFSGYQGSFLEIQWPGHGVNHSCLVSELRISEAYLYFTHDVDRDNIHMVQNRDQ